jgi:hypothetical protein
VKDACLLLEMLVHLGADADAGPFDTTPARGFPLRQALLEAAGLPVDLDLRTLHRQGDGDGTYIASGCGPNNTPGSSSSGDGGSAGPGRQSPGKIALMRGLATAPGYRLAIFQECFDRFVRSVCAPYVSDHWPGGCEEVRVDVLTVHICLFFVSLSTTRHCLHVTARFKLSVFRFSHLLLSDS